MLTRKIAFLAILVVLGCTSCSRGGADQQDEYLVGAYYYSWYPRNFSHGFLRGRLEPRQIPELGLYDSGDPDVARHHIEWASTHGIDFFLLSWWPSRSHQNEAIDMGFLRASNIDDIRFCFFYETQDLGFDSFHGITLMTEEKIARLVDDIAFLADRYFHHPSYLRINGRPVMVFYLTRTINVNYEKAFQSVRGALKALGHDPFIVGDEIFWKVTQGYGHWDENPDTYPPPRQVEVPQWDRVRIFDAVTAYNVYEGGNPEHAGYASESSHFRDVGELYSRYVGETPIIPTVLPGYNDRGVRIAADNYAIPRQWREKGEEGSLFRFYLKHIGKKHADQNLKMFFITSWNEWNEDTAIEPLRVSPPTNQDQSLDGRAYTQGYDYAGFGMTHLETLRDVMIAVSGHVTDAQGRGLGNVEVGAWNPGGGPAARVKTNSSGFYSFSRQRLPHGQFLIGPVDSRDRKSITVFRARTIFNVDFTLQDADQSLSGNASCRSDPHRLRIAPTDEGGHGAFPSEQPTEHS